MNGHSPSDLKPWLKSYEPHVPAEINPSEYKNIVDVFLRSFSKFSDNPAFHNLGRTISYKELDKLSAQFGDYVQNVLGLKKGDRIAQMVVAPVSAVTFTLRETLDATERGTGGHGSTGR